MNTKIRSTRTLALGAAVAAVLAASTLAVPQTQAANTNTDAQKGGGVDDSYALVQLAGDPLSTYTKTKPAKGKKIDFSSTDVKSYRALLSARRNDFKAWLRANAPKAKVTGEYDLALNAVAVQLNGVSLATLRSAPLVVRAEYEGLYSPNVATDPDLGIIRAKEAWTQGGGVATAGAGVKVAIVDSGIDVTHPCFSDGTPVPPGQYTNSRVVVAKVFNNKAGNRGYSPAAIDSHGTHVAGTVACNADTAATVDGVAIPYGISGVAPAALLGNYNVFPADVANARSEDILNALEAAYTDGFDVANMSLGGGASGTQDLLTIAVDNLDAANMVVAVAAGNSGPGLNTVESPGSAARALSAGASSVGHFIAAPVTSGGSSYPGISGELPLVPVSGLTAPLGVVTDASNTINGLSIACTALPAGSLAGKIALVSRGSCTFTTKVRSAQNAGAVGVLVVNNTGGDGIAMATDGTLPAPTVPAYMVSLTDGLSLAGKNGVATSIGSTLAYFRTVNDDIMAGFSSQGPTDVDFRVKPDVVAPGVNVLSSIPVSYCGGAPCFAFFQGTSMATPHLAGSAAVVRSQHPDWSAAQVRSAIVNTAVGGVLKTASGLALEKNVNVVGNGREDVLAAVNATVALDPVSVSFGGVPSGSGQSRQATVQLDNLTNATQTFAVSASSGAAGVSYSVSPASVTIGAGESATVTVTMSAAQGAAPSASAYAGTLRVQSGGTNVARAVLYTLIK